MAESSHSSEHGEEGEVIVSIESNNDVSKEADNSSKCDRESQSGKIPGKVSFEEVLTEAVRRRSKNLPSQENHNVSRREELLRFDTNSCYDQSSWRLLVNKTKSRLMDPPEGMGNSAGGVFMENHDHEDDSIEDGSEDFKMFKFGTLTIFQCVVLLLIILALVCSLSIPIIKRQTLLDLPLWKWEIMVFALICGQLVSDCGIRLVVIIIERNFLLRKRVLYFVYGLKRAVQNFLWLGLVLLVWRCIFDNTFEKESSSRILPYVTKILVCLLVGTLVWLLKTLLVKVLALAFHVNTFFERIQDALFNQYVIETLSGSPNFERNNTQDESNESKFAESPISAGLRAPLLPKNENVNDMKNLLRSPKGVCKRKEDEIRIDLLHKLNPRNISAWNMRRMINIVRHKALATLDEQLLDTDFDDESSLQIRSESQAKKAAEKIFHNVAKPRSKNIYIDDVMSFMGKEEALKAMHLFGASRENEGISKSSIKNWLVNAFRERRALALSLNDTKTSVDDLHTMLNIVVIIIITIIWLVILGIPVTHFLVFISSQLLLVVFIFGNTCKTVFEAIIFLFVMHPFDVGDRCEVDGIQMVVEEMNILTTVFYRSSDNQKVIYPNSVLSTKAISNYHRSPDMKETIEFCIHISTPIQKINTMKQKIIQFVESEKEHWHPSPMVIMREVEEMNKIKMSVWLTHRLNNHESAERWRRRERVIEQMIIVFQQLDIQYRMLPLDLNVRNMPAFDSTRLPSNWTSCAN